MLLRNRAAAAQVPSTLRVSLGVMPLRTASVSGPALQMSHDSVIMGDTETQESMG